jgi:polysaccharide pyruvyl transferase WcaK-like protein
MNKINQRSRQSGRLMATSPRVVQTNSSRARRAISGLRNGITLVASGEPTVPYLGAVSLPNLGDVALLKAIIALLNRVHVQAVPYPRDSFSLRIAKGLGLKPSHFCLGGGTLINSPAPLSGVRRMEAMGLTGFTFGTGVRDPRFWNRVDKFPQEFSQWVESLSQFEQISVRGPHSSQILKEAGLSNVEIIGDPALQFWEPPQAIPALTNKIAFNICRGYGRKIGNDEERIFEQLRVVAKNLLKAGIELVFVSVWEGDDKLTHKFAESLEGGSRISVELVGCDVEGFLRVVSSCDLMISMRLHAAVLAMCRSVPVVSIEYQPKCRDFMDSMDLGRYNIHPDDLDAARAEQLIYDALRCSLEIRDAIRQRATYYQNQQADFAARIRDRILSRGLTV